MNRIEGISQEIRSREASSLGEIRSLAKGLPDEWFPKKQRAIHFLNEIFPLATSLPASVEAAQQAADSLAVAKGAEKARYLPRVGLFGQADLYFGGRANATSSTVGAYVQWNILDASSWGATQQAESVAASAQSRADALKLAMVTGERTARASVEAIQMSLLLLDDSAVLLEEQTQTARNLFREGSINALQLVEVFNRRVDLVLSRSEAERSLIQAKTSQFLVTHREGVDHE